MIKSYLNYCLVTAIACLLVLPFLSLWVFLAYWSSEESRPIKSMRGESGHQHLVSDLRKSAFNLSPIWHMATGLSYTAFIRLNMILLILLSWNFDHKVLTNFVQDYFCIHWKILALAFIYIYNILTDSYAEPHLHPYNKTNLSWLPLWCRICFNE